jgi:GMP synthase (glutamine-hydrolysing)
MSSVLVFRHSLFEPAGMIAEAMELRGIDWRYVDLWETSAREELLIEQAQAVVILGGSMSANDPLPWLRQQERYIVRAISSGAPVLGVCLGAQLLAKCLGAPVGRMERKEIGWRPVRLTDAGCSDPLFQGLRREEVFFHWHGETFELPEGSDKLAESELCGNQAFRFGSNLYGLQFHPEVTPEIISSWLRQDASCGALRETDEPVDPHAHEQRARELADQIFGRWCDLIMAP